MSSIMKDWEGATAKTSYIPNSQNGNEAGESISTLSGANT
jgi:hypothetical protein